jgi:antigen flippase
VVLLNVSTGVITARLLGPEGRGILTAVTIWPQFLSSLADFGITAAIIYFIRNHFGALREIVGAAYVLSTLVGVGATVAGMFCVPLVMAGGPSTIALAETCLLSIWPMVLMTALRDIAVAQGEFRTFTVSTYTPPLLYLAGLLLSWALLGISPAIAAICQMLTFMLGTLSMFQAVNRIVRPRFGSCWPWMKQVFLYSVKLAPSNTSVTLLNYADRLVLVPALPPAELGLYAVAYSLSRLMYVLQTAVGSVLYPAMAGRQREEIKNIHDLAFRLLLYLTAFSALLITLLASFLLVIMYGADYAAAEPLVIILSIEAAITCVTEVVIRLYLSLNDPGYPSVVQMISLAVAIVSLLLLVPFYGATGAAMSLVIAAVLRIVLLLTGLPLRLGMPLPNVLPQLSDIAYVRTRLQ